MRGLPPVITKRPQHKITLLTLGESVVNLIHMATILALTRGLEDINIASNG